MVDIKKMQERLYNQSYKVFFLWTKRPLKKKKRKAKMIIEYLSQKSTFLYKFDTFLTQI